MLEVVVGCLIFVTLVNFLLAFYLWTKCTYVLLIASALNRFIVAIHEDKPLEVALMQYHYDLNKANER